jgi:hypothetical protein
MQRILSREALWNGNRERFQSQFFSKDSLFLWALSSYPKLRKNYPRLLAEPRYAHLQVISFHNRADTRRWLEQLAAAPPAVHPG